jgi:hypothetical protein
MVKVVRTYEQAKGKNLIKRVLYEETLL